MADMGYKIVQTQVYIDPNAQPKPYDFYKSLPITTYDAVRDKPNDESKTLRSDLDDINDLINTKQQKLPGLSASNIVTYAGKAGEVGAIQITNHIAELYGSGSEDRIPTEKAVSDLLRSLGLITNDGDPTGDNSLKVLWSEIIGKPENHSVLGDDPIGYMNQKALTDIIQPMQEEDINLWNQLKDLGRDFYDHRSNQDNPHNVTFEQINKSNIVIEKMEDVVRDHNTSVSAHQSIQDAIDDVAHNLDTKSKSFEDSIDKLEDDVEALTGTLEGFKFVTDLEYHQRQGKLVFTKNDGTNDEVTIITDSLVQSVEYNEDTQMLVVTTLGGLASEIDLGSLFENYVGDPDSQIEITVDENNHIKAELKEGSIREEHLGEGCVVNDKIKDGTIGNEKLQDGTITGDKIAENTITEKNIKPGSLSSNVLEENSIYGNALADGAVKTNHLSDNAVTEQKISDDSISESKIKDNAVTSTKINDKSVTSEKINDGAVTEIQLGDEAVTNNKVKQHSLQGDRLVESAVLDTPKLSESPSHERINDHSIPDIEWVLEELENHLFNSDNIQDKGITAEKLFTSNYSDRVLAVKEPNTNPEWSKVTMEMLETGSVSTPKIKDQSVTHMKLKDGSVITTKIAKHSVTEEKICENAVTLDKIVKSFEPNKVLGVGNELTHPSYTEITTPMLAKAVITNDRIAENAVTLDKIAPPSKQDPELSVESDDNVLMLFDTEEQSPKFGQLESKYIKESGINLDRLEKSTKSFSVLGVYAGNTSPKYVKINPFMFDSNFVIPTRMIADEAVTTDKIDDHSITNDKLALESIEGYHLKDHGITLNKLAVPFGLSKDRVSVLGIEKDGSDVVYTKVSDEMIQDHTISLDKFKTPEESNKVIVSDDSKSVKYDKLKNEYFEDGTISGEKFVSDISLPGKPKASQHPDAGEDSLMLATTGWVRSILHNANLVPENNQVPTLAQGTVPLENLVTSETLSHVVVGLEASKSLPKYMKITVDMLDPNFKLKTEHMPDGVIVTRSDQISDNVITNNMMTTGSVSSKNIIDDIELGCGAHTNHFARFDEPHVRDIQIGRELPTNARPGTIFILY